MTAFSWEELRTCLKEVVTDPLFKMILDERRCFFTCVTELHNFTLLIVLDAAPSFSYITISTDDKHETLHIAYGKQRDKRIEHLTLSDENHRLFSLFGDAVTELVTNLNRNQADAILAMMALSFDNAEFQRAVFCGKLIEWELLQKGMRLYADPFVLYFSLVSGVSYSLHRTGQPARRFNAVPEPIKTSILDRLIELRTFIEKEEAENKQEGEE